MYPKKSYKAFTLAEVLITLLIIGVVASLVIPNFLQDTQNEELNVQFKKDFSNFNDATKRMMTDNGGNLAGLFANSLDSMNKYGEYVIFTKKCPAYTINCFHTGITTWKNLHGDAGWINHTDYPTAIMANGSLARFNMDRSDCEYNYGTGSVAEHSCGDLVLDVNGFKGPNQAGRDIFYLWVTKTGIYPHGIPNDIYSNINTYCNKNNATSISGKACAVKVLKGEKID
jgi:prepilin-type N-terminal cleavage/methylation domain-containing protein